MLGGISTTAWIVALERREFQAKLAFGMQEWLKRAQLGRMEVRPSVCQAFELKMSTTFASP